MIATAQGWRLPVAVAVLVSLLLASAALSQTSYEAGVAARRAEIERKLKAEDGWLAVSGLFWLKEGANSFGDDPAGDIVLPPGSCPRLAGRFILNQNKIKLAVAAGVVVTLDGDPVATRDVKTDAAGRPEVFRLGRLSLFVIKRGNRYGIRVRDQESQARREFTGLNWFPVQAAYRVTAQFTPYEPRKEIPIANVLGDVQPMQSPGVLTFSLNGRQFTLDPLEEDGGKLFIIFRDATSGKSTYGAGRFLYADPPKDGRVVLDFNLAVNPPCAFTAYATCPLPPKQNIMNTAVEAGEKTYNGAGSERAPAAAR